MYSYHHPWGWFRQFSDLFNETEILVYKLLPNQVMKYGFRNGYVGNALGRVFVAGLRSVERHNALFRVSQYVAVVFTK